MPKIAEGRKAPDFTLEDAAGRRVSLAKHSAQVLEAVRSAV